MTPKKLAGLVGVFLLITAAATLLRWQAGKIDSEDPLEKITIDEVTRLQIDRKGKTITVERAEGVWRLVQPVLDMADQSSADVIASQLLQLKLGSIVSESPESYSRYDLDELKSVRIRVYAADEAVPIFDGYFGKQGLGYDSVYFRRHGKKPVYLASGLTSYQIERNADYYRERALFRIPADDLRTVSFRTPGKTVTLTKSSGAWTAEGSGLDGEAAAALIRSLADLRITAFPEIATGTLFKKKPYLFVEGKGTVREFRFIIGRPRQDDRRPGRWIRVDGRESVMVVGLGEIEALRAALSP